MQASSSVQARWQRSGHPVQHHRRRPVSHRAAAVPEWMRELMDFGSWAPKSTRIWRLNHYAYPSSEADAVDELEAKVNRLNNSSNAAGSAAGSARSDVSSEAVDTAAPQAAQQGGTSRDMQAEMADLPPTGSFSDAGDDELAMAFSRRLKSLSSVDDVAAAADGPVMVGEGEDAVPELTGEEMRQLIYTKYGKSYDCSFVRRDIPGKRFICLNIMWQHAEQRSFRMTPEQYAEKMDGIAYLVNALGQTRKVRDFLLAPPKAQRGLPKRPVVGCAVSIQFDLEPHVIDEWFSAGYF